METIQYSANDADRYTEFDELAERTTAPELVDYPTESTRPVSGHSHYIFLGYGTDRRRVEVNLTEDEVLALAPGFLREAARILEARRNG